MVEKQFNVELTLAGQQFVIPGTEKPTPLPRKIYAKEGSQLVIPGAEQISPKALVNRLMQKPIRPRVGQRALASTALFGAANEK
jgi:hypothetical protein